MGSDEATWLGSLSTPSLLDRDLVAQVNALADAAKVGDWAHVLRLVNGELKSAGPNVWRPGGSSGFTPLHQAAWHGAPAGVVQDLISSGAWRTMPARDGQTAADVANQRGHGHLSSLLEPPKPFAEPSHVAALDRRLDELVSERSIAVGAGRLRPLPTLVLQELPAGQRMWFPIPGMYGGFAVELRHRFLLVESWSRVVGGSGVAHVITKDMTAVVDQGFV